MCQSIYRVYTIHVDKPNQKAYLYCAHLHTKAWTWKETRSLFKGELKEAKFFPDEELIRVLPENFIPMPPILALFETITDASRFFHQNLSLLDPLASFALVEKVARQEHCCA